MESTETSSAPPAALRPLLGFPVLAFGLTLVITFVTLLPLCDRIFGCGCTFGGAAHCNVHHADGPKCPWCAHGNRNFAVAYGVTVFGILCGVVGGQRLGGRSSRWRGWWSSVLGGLVMYGATAAAVGLYSAIYWHYPTWFGIHVSG